MVYIYICAKSRQILQNAEHHVSIEIDRCENMRSIETEACQEAKTSCGPELLRNESNRPRYILVLRFWHPGLTEAGTYVPDKWIHVLEPTLTYLLYQILR